MNKIIPIVGIAAVIAVVGIIVTSTGGISSVSYASMSCEELGIESSALMLSTPPTAAGVKDQLNQLNLVREAYESKDCAAKANAEYYATLDCTDLNNLLSWSSNKASIRAEMENKNC